MDLWDIIMLGCLVYATWHAGRAHQWEIDRKTMPRPPIKTSAAASSCYPPTDPPPSTRPS